MLTSRTAAVFVYRTGVADVFFVEEVHFAVPGEDVAVAGVAAGHYAVEEVDAAVDGFEDVAGGADAH